MLKMWKTISLLFFSSAALFLFSSSRNLKAQTYRDRVALVIGNADYSNRAGRLRTSINDARDIGAALEELNFEVIEVADAGLEEMLEAAEEFYQRIDSDTLSLFYYAGHGMQYDGENYLIPLGADLEHSSDLLNAAFPVTEIIDKITESGSTGIIILDACRDNPLAAITRSWGAPVEQGLAEINNSSGNLFIAYATSPGKLAIDSYGSERNGLFTGTLLEYIQTPNLSLSEIFINVTQDVLERTNDSQRPWSQFSLTDRIIINVDVSIDLHVNPYRGETSGPQNSQYPNLAQALDANQWQAADQRTRDIMLNFSNNQRWLNEDDVEDFPCDKLRIINQLWDSASNGNYGFSAQRRVWSAQNGRDFDDDEEDYARFAQTVRWQSRGLRIEPSYSGSAPNGHLPYAFLDGPIWGIFLDRVDECLSSS